jgi:hypothetical protein
MANVNNPRLRSVSRGNNWKLCKLGRTWCNSPKRNLLQTMCRIFWPLSGHFTLVETVEVATATIRRQWLSRRVVRISIDTSNIWYFFDINIKYQRWHLIYQVSKILILKTSIRNDTKPSTKAQPRREERTERSQELLERSKANEVVCWCGAPSHHQSLNIIKSSVTSLPKYPKRKI